MRQSFCVAALATSLLFFSSSGCAQALTPEQEQSIAGLKDDLKRIQGEIDQALQDPRGCEVQRRLDYGSD